MVNLKVVGAFIGLVGLGLICFVTWDNYWSVSLPNNGVTQRVTQMHLGELDIV